MTRILFISVIVAAVVATATPAAAQAPMTVFKGRPQVKIVEQGVARSPETVDRQNASNLECVISQIGDSYYWASRENKPLVRRDSGGFVTFVAADGAGYVRVVTCLGIFGPAES